MSGCCGVRLFVHLMIVVVATADAAMPRPGVAASDRGTRTITLADARSILTALTDNVPRDLRDWAGADGELHWSSWMKQHEANLRTRLETGDEDSVVNLMLYGTSFTRRPRATPGAIAASAANSPLVEVMDGRVEDLATAIESPGGDSRLQFVRSVIERHGIDVGASTRATTRRYLIGLRSRVLSENERYMRRLAAAAADASQRPAAEATLYRDRGLSTDTTLRVDFALEQTLAALHDRGELGPRSVNRTAVVGPGLDFVDKAQGYDFFPVQTIQPFAITDSMLRLGIAERPAVVVLDVNPRVIAHLREARQRAGHRQPYRLHALLEHEPVVSHLDPGLVEYWRRFGDRLGPTTAGEVPAAYAGQARARVIDVRPETVLEVSEVELNVVLERLPEETSRFDLIVATNVLVYYDTFEQALAVSNMASMLRAGGLLMTNQPVPIPAVCGLSPVLIMSVGFDRVQSETGSHERGDSIFVYRKA